MYRIFGHIRVVRHKLHARDEVDVVKDENIVALLDSKIETNVQELATIELAPVIALLDDEDLEGTCREYPKECKETRGKGSLTVRLQRENGQVRMHSITPLV